MTAEAALPVPPSRRQQSFSELLQQIADAHQGDRVGIGDLLQAMQGRAIAALLFIFAFPNILPTPPGTAGILGLPLLFLSAQMMLGLDPWLPGFIARRSMARGTFQALVERITPWLLRAERLLKARMELLAHPRAQRLLGALCLTVSVALVLPVPFANLVPSVALCIIGLGVLERDGLWTVLGVLAAFGSLVYVAGLAYALVKSAVFVLMNAF